MITIIICIAVDTLPIHPAGTVEIAQDLAVLDFAPIRSALGFPPFGTIPIGLALFADASVVLA